MPIAASEYPFLEIFGTIVIFFAWVAWFSTVISVLGDVFRRHDLSGWGKAGWTLVIVVIPFLGVLFYLGAEGRNMAERSAQQVSAQQAQFKEYIRDAAGTDAAKAGAASEIAQAQQLRDSGAITDAEFEQLKRKALT
jgi:hypothetical protein